MPVKASIPPMCGDPPDKLPEQTGVVVIGGGVAGVGAALALAEAKIDTVLLEKGRVAAEQSSRNWGWVRKQGRIAHELPLMIEATDLWRRIADECGEEIGFRIHGVTYLAETEAELAARATWMEHARAFQLDTRVLSSKETDDLLEQTDRRFAGALHTPSDAQAEPALAVPAMARLAARKGVNIVEGCAVRGLLREGGRIAGVVTESGPVRADAVILAGGAWSRVMMENEGLSLPQLAIRSSAMRTAPVERFAKGGFGATGASIRCRADGGVTVARSGAAGFDLVPAAFRHLGAFWPTVRGNWRILKLRVGYSFFGPLGRQRWGLNETSPFERVRVLDPLPDQRLLTDVMRDAKRLFPQLRIATPVQSWAGMIDVTPDETPIIGPVTAVPGLVLATGLSGHGFGLGPGVGKLAAQLATGAEPLVDPAPFAPSRFDKNCAEGIAA